MNSISQSDNWVSRFATFFLHRRQLVVVLFLLLAATGAVSLSGLRREGFPQVPVKVVVVSTVYKGAAASELEQTVTNPIEAAVKDLKEVKSIQSTSAESHSSVVITLNENAGVDQAVQDITSKVSSISLPKAADKPDIAQPTTGSSAWVIGLTGNMSNVDLLAQGRIFQREIEQVKGIKQVELASTFDDKIFVTFQPDKLSALGVDSSKIAGAIGSANVNFPAGQDLNLDGSRATVLVAGRYSSLDDLGAAPLPTVKGGTVKLSDVATISRGIDQDGRLNRIGYVQDGKVQSHTGINYNVDIRSDADILTVNLALADNLKKLQDDGTLSPQLHIVRLFDDAASTQQQVSEIKAGAIGEKWQGIGAWGYAGYLFGGIWLLMMAMFLFVNLRTALIAGLAIPLSLLFTVVALFITGNTLNTLTLFSMILILGLIVDPAIVVLESIQRHKDMGLPTSEAVTKAIRTIGYGLLMATLCSIIVFTPFGVVNGIFGAVIKYIPITVLPALVASFFVPLVFLTPLGSRFIKPKIHKPDITLTTEEQALWAASRWFKRANLFILHRLWLQIPIMLLAIILPVATTWFLFSTDRVKSVQFSKPNDTTEAMVSVAYPASLTDAQIRDIATQTENVLNAHSEVKSYYYISQTPGGFSLYLNLTSIGQRAQSSAVVSDLAPKLPNNPARQIFASAHTLSYGPPQNDFPVQVQVYDSDLTKLKKFAVALGDYARTHKDVYRVSDGYTDGATGSVQISVNDRAAAAHGLDTTTIGAQVAGLLGTTPLTKVQLGENQLDAVARYLGADKYNSAAQLLKLPISTPTGPVPLSTVASVSGDTGAGAIQHQDGSRYATVKAALNSGANQSQVQQDLNNWAKDHLAQYGLKANATQSKGEGDDIAASFVNLFEALGIAILMIYLVLALFFGSFLKPIIITFALPLSFIGVFPTLAILHQEFGFLEIIGLITLAGIVVNVGIFVIDYANHRVAEGMDVREAISQATAVRFRPIFLTKITALGSLLPLAILSPFWRGLASVIIAGILTSGILSLFTTPILYTWFTALAQLPARLRARRLT